MHPGCFEKAASEKMAALDGGPQVLVIRLGAPKAGAEEYGDEKKSKAKMLFDLVNDAVGMQHEWTPEIEEKIVAKLESM